MVPWFINIEFEQFEKEDDMPKDMKSGEVEADLLNDKPDYMPNENELFRYEERGR